jgi:hypothetical protein
MSSSPTGAQYKAVATEMNLSIAMVSRSRRDLPRGIGAATRTVGEQQFPKALAVFAPELPSRYGGDPLQVEQSPASDDSDRRRSGDV